MGVPIPPQLRPGRVDVAIGSALLIGVLLYHQASPHPLGYSDEGYFLVHVKRTLLGQAAYRDFHEQYTPIGYYLMAIPMFLFGANITTVTCTMAAVHGATLMLVYAAARSLGVGRWIAAACGALYFSLCQPAWPMASGHWVAALFLVSILFVLCGARPGAPGRSGRLLLAGVMTGLLFGVQHHKGPPIAAAVLAVIACDHLVAGRFGGIAVRTGLARSLALYLVGAAGVGGLLLLALWMQSSVGELVDQLFLQVLRYAEVSEVSWGEIPTVVPGLGGGTIPALLKYLPILLLLGAVRAALAHRAGGAGELRRLALLIFYCGGAAVSILYNADFIHIAMVAAPFFVFLAETVQWGADRLGGRLGGVRFLRLPEAAFGLAILAGCVVHLQGVIERATARFSYSADTDFGRIDFETANEVSLVAAVRRAMDQVPERELVCYPHCASMYLMTAASNPTPYDLIFYPGYHRKEQLKEIIATIEERRLPYVVLMGLFLNPTDLVVRHVRRHYELIHPVREGTSGLYRRKSG